MRKNKYARNRRKLLRLVFLFTAIVVLLRLMSNSRSYVLSTVIAILICLPFWIICFLAIFKFRKQIRRSNALYDGTIEEVLENCADRSEEYALLDKGIFSYSSGRLSLYGDITRLTPRDIGITYQIWIYEDHKKVSALIFEIGEERDGFLDKIRYERPEITIEDNEGLPSK
jgi:hypothetical protein